MHVYDVTNQIFTSDSNFIADVVMWLKFGNSSIYIREVVITSILQGFDQNKHFLKGCLG